MECVKFHAGLNSSKSEKALRKRGWGSGLINEIYSATSQTQAAAGLNFPHKRLKCGFYGPGPAVPVYQDTLQKSFGAHA